MMDGQDGSDRPVSVAESAEAVPSHLFRRQALEQLTSPEQLDHLMQITSPRGWLALGALACLVATALVWSVAGNVPAEASGQGVLLRPPGIYQIQAAGAGTITDLRVRAGDTVRAGQAIATLTAPGGTETEITSQRDGLVLAVLVEQYLFVHPGTTVVTIEPPTESMQAIVYVSAAQARGVARGMTAHISPQAVSAERYGFVLGTVASVSQYPASPEQIRRTVANEAIARTFADGGPVVEIRVDLVRDPGAPSGFKWSASRRPSVQLASGMLCSVEIILREQRPINLVFPTSNE